jgi:hypothetical protein
MQTVRLRVLGDCQHEGQWFDVRSDQRELWAYDSLPDVINIKTRQAVTVSSRLVYLRHSIAFGTDIVEFLVPLGMRPVDALRRLMCK